jgi:hypothetical protein
MNVPQLDVLLLVAASGQEFSVQAGPATSLHLTHHQVTSCISHIHHPG